MYKQFFAEQVRGWYYKITVVVAGIVALGLIGNFLN